QELLVALQNYAPTQIAQWKKLVHISLESILNIYKIFNIRLQASDTYGDSFYQALLWEIMEDLIQKGVAIEQDGLIVSYIQEMKNKDGLPMAVILRKSKGAYLYITTDLACIWYRILELK